MCSAGSSHQHGVHPDRRCTLDIAQLVVSDEHRTVRGDARRVSVSRNGVGSGFPRPVPHSLAKTTVSTSASTPSASILRRCRSGIPLVTIPSRHRSRSFVRTSFDSEERRTRRPMPAHHLEQLSDHRLIQAEVFDTRLEFAAPLWTHPGGPEHSTDTTRIKAFVRCRCRRTRRTRSARTGQASTACHPGRRGRRATHAT